MKIFDIEFTKEGVWFPYYKDRLLYVWFWTNTLYRFKSSYLLSMGIPGIDSIKDYWIEIGRVEKQGEKLFGPEKIIGISQVKLLEFYLSVAFNHGYYCVLYDIVLESKSRDFWASIPESKVKAFREPFVIIKCKDKDSAENICRSIDLDFARSFAWCNGEVVIRNTL